ncbi:unnamed protein product [Ectocarpus sp. 6 AP-2014]
MLQTVDRTTLVADVGMTAAAVCLCTTQEALETVEILDRYMLRTVHKTTLVAAVEMTAAAVWLCTTRHYTGGS